jgi:hypothetical protein
VRYKDGKEAKVGDVVKFVRVRPPFDRVAGKWETLSAVGYLTMVVLSDELAHNGRVDFILHATADGGEVLASASYQHVRLGDCELLFRWEETQTSVSDPAGVADPVGRLGVDGSVRIPMAMLQRAGLKTGDHVYFDDTNGVLRVLTGEQLDATHSLEGRRG